MELFLCETYLGSLYGRGSIVQVGDLSSRLAFRINHEDFYHASTSCRVARVQTKLDTELFSKWKIEGKMIVEQKKTISTTITTPICRCFLKVVYPDYSVTEQSYHLISLSEMRLFQYSPVSSRRLNPTPNYDSCSNSSVTLRKLF